MVASLIRLSLTLQANQLKRSVWAIVGTVFAGLYGLWIFGMGMVALVSLGGSPDLQLRTAVLVLIGSVLVLGWIIVPPLFTGMDQTLDPSRFATMTVPPRTLAVGLFLAGLISPFGIAMLLVGLTWGAATRDSFLSFLLGSLGGVLGAVLCIALARLGTTALAALMRSRVFRESSTAVAFAVLMLVGPIIAGISFVLVDEGLRSSMARILHVTPLGAPWVWGADTAAGDVGSLLLHVGVTLVSLVLVLGLWAQLLQKELTEAGAPAKGAKASKQKAGSGIIANLGSGPLGALTARSLLYWRKDQRYSLSFIALPVFIVLFIVQFSTTGSFSLLFLFLLAFIVAWGLSMDTSYDSTAHWTMVAAGVRGIQERGARVLSYAVIGVPTLIIAAVAAGVLSGSVGFGAVCLALMLGIWGLTAGLGVVISSVYVQATTKPNESVFTQRTGGMIAMLVQFGGMGAVALVSLVPCLLVGAGWEGQDAAKMWLGAGIMLVLGAAALVVGLLVSARLWEKHQVRLLEQLVAIDNG